MDPSQVLAIGLKNPGKKPSVAMGGGNREITFILRFFSRRWLIYTGAKVVLSQVEKNENFAQNP